MEKRKTSTVIVLALEIAVIVILHAIKINQTDKPPTGTNEMSRNSSILQTDAPMRSIYSLWALK
jgi:hypothetical protein